MLRITLIGVLVVSATFQLLAQPCLNGWGYRTEISVDNSMNSNALNDYQVLLNLNTQQLITDGKLNVDGSDLRFTDNAGGLYSYWIDPNTINTTNTKVRVRISDALPTTSTVSIYMFYGAPSAPSASDGVATFELFDDFDSTNVDNSLWATCGPGTQNNASSELTLAGGTSKIISHRSFDEEVIVQANVTNITNNGYIGLTDSVSSLGHSMQYNVAPAAAMYMKKNTVAACFPQTDLTVIQSYTSSVQTGDWYFSWYMPNNVRLNWDGSAVGEIDYSTIIQPYPASNEVHAAVGIEGASSFSLDWVFVRKFANQEPVLTIGSETSILIPTILVSSNSPVCKGDTLRLTAFYNENALYSWSGPNGFASTDSVALIPNTNLANEGTYQLSVSSIAGCNVQLYELEVEVADSSIGGTTSLDDTLCASSGNGLIHLTGNVGNVIRWESSPTGMEPWNSISNTTDSLAYMNLISTVFYRAVVQSGNCDEAYSSSTKITIDPLSIGGKIIGADEVCENANAGNLSLTSNTGTINNWQYSINGGASWTSIVSAASTISYSNLTTTRLYRVEVQSGECPVQFSDTVTVLVNPTPNVSFAAGDTCQGNASLFTNGTTIATGSITSYQWDFKDGESSSAKDPLHLYAASGTYSVVLFAFSDKGCSASDTSDAIVLTSPAANFSFSGVCAQSPTNFTNLSNIASGSITNNNWVFESGATSIATDPMYTYNVDSSYLVKLVATSNLGCLDSVEIEVDIAALPLVDFQVDTTCLSDVVVFNNLTTSTSSNVSYSWGFGDASTSSIEYPTHQYASANTYNVLLQATTNLGCVADSIKQVVILDAPVVNFSISDHCQGDSLVLTDLTTGSGAGFIYNWSFGDGLTSSSTEPAHLYATSGTFPVQLSVSSPNGCADNIIQVVAVSPVPNANFSNTDACTDAATQFDNFTTIASGNLTYNWTFGDGNVSVQTAPSHTYLAEGGYFVRLIATSDAGCIDSITKGVTAQPNPRASFTFTSPCDGNPSQFNSISSIASGGINAYTWSFGDGNSSGIEDPVHQFMNFGSYSVKLVVVSDKGCMDDTTITAFVNELPVVNFSAEDACLGESIEFINSSSVGNGNLSYLWKLGNGDSSNAEAPIIDYTTDGLQTVTLIALTDSGCTDSITKGVYVFETPVLVASDDTSVSKGFSVPLSATGGENCVWQPFESLDNSLSCSPLASPLETTLYIVTTYSSFGCSVSDSVLVTVINDRIVTATNVFTPDGSGQNETWYVDNILSYPNNRVTVLDRNGAVVYQQSNYQNDWDGTSDGDLLPDGTYYYIIEFIGEDIHYKGAVTIIRNNP